MLTINRGNISKIFGELITLLEADKRKGEINEVSVTLPYSNKPFSVPSNLYIIGTMNTADRSVGYIDYAVRRRFTFHTIKAERTVIENYYANDAALKEKALKYYDDVHDYIYTHDNVVELSPNDIMVGHSYFLAKNEDELDDRFENEVKPLLREYYSDGITRLSSPLFAEK